MTIGQIHKPLHTDETTAKVIEWYPTDTEENFRELMKNHDYAAYFISRGWDKPGSILYRLNSQGFRGDEFDSEQPNLVALGDSFSFGIGLPQEDTWPELVGKKLGLRVHNLSIPGCSADRCFALAEYWLPILRPQKVFMLTPCRGRLDVILENGHHETVMPSDVYDGRLGLDQGLYYKKWVANEQNSWVNLRRNEAAVAGLCASLNIEVCVFRADEAFSRSREEIGFARDCMHAGPLGHEILADNLMGIRSDYRRYY